MLVNIIRKIKISSKIYPICSHILFKKLFCSTFFYKEKINTSRFFFFPMLHHEESPLPFLLKSPHPHPHLNQFWKSLNYGGRGGGGSRSMRLFDKDNLNVYFHQKQPFCLLYNIRLLV